MGLLKKILLFVFGLVLVGGGIFYYLNSKDHYDPDKYSAKITAPAAKSTSQDASVPDGVEVQAEVPSGLVLGMKVELTLPDQFDAPQTIGDDVKTLLFAFSKDAGGTVRGYLDKQEETFLATHKALFIADISPIPVVIRNQIALPKLRKSSYSVMLIYEEEMAAALMNTKHESDIAVVTITENVVQNIRYVNGEAELAALFE